MNEQNFFADVASGDLPPVSFVKPIGKNNEHPGYSDVVTGQQHVADLVAAVQKSKIWRECVIIITYDENGGRWDHVASPVRTTAGVLACASLASLSHHLLAGASSTAQNMRP
jgi:phospholipase C